MELINVINDFADALRHVDSTRPVEGSFQAGIGPHTEDHSRDLALRYLKNQSKTALYYKNAGSLQYPGRREMCDVIIPQKWAIELKLLRPYGDNDKESEHWSSKLIHPYYGNKSAVGDALKLLSSDFIEKKAIVLFSYEHEIPRLNTDPVIKIFELILSNIHSIKFKPRIVAERRGLVHPTFQVLKVIGWELETLDAKV
jgi:hypothetical protein